MWAKIRFILDGAYVGLIKFKANEGKGPGS